MYALGLSVRVWRFFPKDENHMEKKMEIEMETGILEAVVGIMYSRGLVSYQDNFEVRLSTLYHNLGPK